MIYLLFILLFIPIESMAMIRYVDGSSSGCGTSSPTYTIATRTCGSGTELVYSTIAGALGATVSGDTVYIRAGTYAVAVDNIIPSGPGPGFTSVTTVAGYTGERPIIQPPSYLGGWACGLSVMGTKHSILVQNLVIDDTNCSGGAVLRVSSTDGTTTNIPSYLWFDNLELKNSPHAVLALFAMNNSKMTNTEIHGGTWDEGTPNKVAHGVYMQSGSGNTFDRLYVHDNTGFGMQEYPYATGSIITNSIFKDNQTSNTACGCAALVVNGDTNTVTNNVIITDRGIGFGILYGSTNRRNSLIANNSIYGKGTGNQGIYLSGNTGTMLKNNIVIGFSTAIFETGNTGTVLTTNLTAGVATSIWNSPSTGDLTLKSGSVAINAGTNIGITYNGSAPDQGAFETFVFATCQVPNGSSTKVQLTFTNNLSPPLLPSSSITGFTFRKNGVSNAVVSSARVGDNILEFTLTNAYVGGDTSDFSVTTSNLTDSSLKGNLTDQPYIETLTNQSCTNNAGGAPTYTFTQSDFEWHGLHGAETSPEIKPDGAGSSGAAENYTRMTIYPCGSIRLRVSVKCGVATCPATAFYLYNSIDNGSSYSLVPDTLSTNNIMFCGNSVSSDVPSNGIATTDQLSTAGTFTAGGFIRTSNAIPTIASMSSGNKTEMEFCINFGPSATGTYLFQLRKQDGSVLDSYDHTPSLTISNVFGGSGF